MRLFTGTVSVGPGLYLLRPLARRHRSQCLVRARGSVLAIGISLMANGACAEQRPPVPENAEYLSERVTFSSEGIKLSGILWTPRSPGPYPALVLVEGSGRTTADRMEPWARRFTEWGFACLSYDKRGVGESGGRFIGGYAIDIPLLARDAVAAVDYLMTREEIVASRIGLLGPSQAGWVIPVAAVESDAVSFTVIYSGATVSLGEEQYFSRLSGDDPFWKVVYGDLSLAEISRRMEGREPSLFDPVPYLQRQTVPGLWLYGELDRSQPTRESVETLDDIIADYNRDFGYEVFEGADHSLRVDGELAPGVFELVRGWLAEQTGSADR